MAFHICPECGGENQSYHCETCGRIELTAEQRALDVKIMQRTPAMQAENDRLSTRLARLTELLGEAILIGQTALSDEGHDHDECEHWVRLAAIRAEGGIK